MRRWTKQTRALELFGEKNRLGRGSNLGQAGGNLCLWGPERFFSIVRNAQYTYPLFGRAICNGWHALRKESQEQTLFGRGLAGMAFPASAIPKTPCFCSYFFMTNRLQSYNLKLTMGGSN